MVAIRELSDSQNGQGDNRHERNRKNRMIVDFNWSYKNWLENRNVQGRYNGEAERHQPNWFVKVLPPTARPDEPGETIPAKLLHSSLNKVRHPVNAVKWTPDARRLLTASNSGELTLWNGQAFNFETIMQAHDSAIRTLAYSNQQDFLLSGDQDGVLKYWQTNLNNIKALQAHSDCVRGISFARGDAKFVTASDDQSLKIWDFTTSTTESTLTGHNWDVKAVDWHPQRGLICSGSKDHLVKLWDPRTQRCLTTLHYHKNTVSKVAFSPLVEDWLATASRDQTARIFDLRMMRDIWLLRGHEKDIASLAWHPIHKTLITTSGSEGSLFHYILDCPNNPPDQADTISPYDSAEPLTHPAQTLYPFHKIPYAHDYGVSGLDWHPLGHILATGSNDRSTKFWMRPLPGDESWVNDRYHVGEALAEERGQYTRFGARRAREEVDAQESDDEAEGLMDQKMPAKSIIPGMSIPGLPQATNQDRPMIGSRNDLGPDSDFNSDFTPLHQPSANLYFPPIMQGANGMPLLPPELLKILQQQPGGPFAIPPLPPPPIGLGQGMPGMTGLPFPPPFPPLNPEDLLRAPSSNRTYPIKFNSLLSDSHGAQSAGAGDTTVGLSEINSMRRRAPLPSQQESLKAARQRGERY